MTSLFLSTICILSLGAGAVLVARFFIRTGMTKEKESTLEKEKHALQDEVRKLNSRPRTDADRVRLFERARVKAREKSKR